MTRLGAGMGIPRISVFIALNPKSLPVEVGEERDAWAKLGWHFGTWLLSKNLQNGNDLCKASAAMQIYIIGGGRGHIMHANLWHCHLKRSQELWRDLWWCQSVWIVLVQLDYWWKAAFYIQVCSLQMNIFCKTSVCHVDTEFEASCCSVLRHSLLTNEMETFGKMSRPNHCIVTDTLIVECLCTLMFDPGNFLERVGMGD